MNTQLLVAIALGMAAPALVALIVRLWGVPGERRLPPTLLLVMTVSVVAVCNWCLFWLQLSGNRFLLYGGCAVALVCTSVVCATLLRHRLRAHWLLARDHWSCDEVAKALQLIVQFYRAPDIQFRLRVQWVAGQAATKDKPARVAQLRVYINSAQKWHKTLEVGWDDQVILRIGRTFNCESELAHRTHLELIWLPHAQNPEFEFYPESVPVVA